VGRGPEWAWRFVVAVPAAGVLSFIAQQLGWTPWAQGVVGVAGMTATAIVPVSRGRAQQDHTRAQLLDQRVTVSGGHGQLPRVRDVELRKLRVHDAQVQVPYIVRDRESELEEAVEPGHAAL
jgi:hypothetical protein